MCDLGSGLAKKHYSNGFNNGFNNGFDNGFSGGQIELIQNYMYAHDLSAEKAMEGPKGSPALCRNDQST